MPLGPFFKAAAWCAVLGGVTAAVATDGDGAAVRAAARAVSVDDVQLLLRAWTLDRAFGACFQDMQADGYFLTALLAAEPAANPVDRCDAATDIHWAKLRAVLTDEWQADPMASVAEAAAHAANAQLPPMRPTERPRRRLSATDAFADYSGVRIKKDKAAIYLGAEGDVVLARSGANAVTIDADVNITGTLSVSGVGGGHLQCAELDLSDVVGRFNGTATVANGDYVDVGSIHCDTGFYPVSKVRWVCTEEGGAAVPTSDLCKPFVCAGVDATSDAGLLLHGGTYAGRQAVASGERLVDTGAIGNCTGTDAASEIDGHTLHYVAHANATWICPEDGGDAVPSEELCVCSEDVCSDWVLLLDGASYGGAWDAEYEPLAYGDFSQLIAVWQSGYVSCDSSYDSAGKASHPWNACGASHGSCDGIDIFSWEFLINDDFVFKQSSWCALPSGCEVPDTSTGDIYCTGDFTIEEGDTLTPTWLEAQRPQSIADNSGTIYINVYGLPAASR